MDVAVSSKNALILILDALILKGEWKANVHIHVDSRSAHIFLSEDGYSPR